MLSVLTGYFNRTKLVNFAIAWAHGKSSLNGRVYPWVCICTNLVYSRDTLSQSDTLMTQSMTAFARAQIQFETSTLCWEIRSVNHRYLEMSFRLPEAFRFLETELRNVLREQCSRGKIECQLKVAEDASQPHSIAINQDLVSALIKLGEGLAAKNHLANDLTLATVLNWPGVVQVAQPDMEGMGKQTIELFKQAVTELCQARKSEGKALTSHLQTRLQRMHEEVNKAKGFISEAVIAACDKLLSRLHALKLDIDNQRVEQEIAMMLTRLDVSEELDRLQVHLLEVARIISNTESAGRRLDFLMQELNREANTLGSKSDSAALTQCAIEMKVLIEQMREQIQNIE